MTAPEEAKALRQSLLLAMTGTWAMIAHQVAGKAARDGFFLDAFSPADLPKMVVVAALLSFLLAFRFGRAIEKFGTKRLVTGAFLLSSCLHILEWFTLRLAERPTAVFIYLHIVGLGAILMSGFWLLLSEVFDLREAKQHFGRVAAAGTVGGILGGLAAERFASLLSVSSLLFLLASLHLIGGLVAARLKPQDARPAKAAEPVHLGEAFRNTPILWRLAALVFMGTCTAALLDYLFKLGATLAIGKGPALVRYFALYYTGCQISTFLFQSFLATPAVQRLGVARSVASLPFTVGVGATAALLIPVYPMVALARAIEVTMRGSLFRSAYEFLYTPVPPKDKRAVKTIVDVGCDRLGDAVGAGAVQLMVMLGPTLARPEILGLTMLLAAASTVFALRLDSAYRSVLEKSLVEKLEEEGEAAGMDANSSLVNTIFEGLPALQSMARVRKQEGLARSTPAAPRPAPLAVDPVVQQLAELRSPDAQRVMRALGDDQPFEPLLVPQVIRLLAWNQVSALARAYLERGGAHIAGQLRDALTDQDLDFGIRRRIPRLLARVPSQMSMESLIDGLRDQRFEVRQQCGRALESMHRHYPELRVPREDVLAAIDRELAVSPSVWKSRRLLDARDSSDQFDFLDQGVAGQADHSLEHVFSLLAVVFAREPVLATYRALHQQDRMFRGLALEYLETVLEDKMRRRLWELLEEIPAVQQPAKSRAEIEQELMATNAVMLRTPKTPSSDAAGSEPKPPTTTPTSEPR